MWYSYAILRLVPRVEREEFLNVGIILFVRASGFLAVRTHVDRQRISGLQAEIDIDQVERRLQAYEWIANGDPRGGVLSEYAPPERFHWLSSPRSTVIQPSPVRTGCSEDPLAELDHLFRTLVKR
ncbi:MAG: DUF3037 domain-containing protein [Chloroflexota bacterium]